MTNSKQALHQEILQKKTILDNAKTQLKKEFVGIDSVIDEALDNLSSWYLFPDLQERPVIINLWGLTGTGKSSLVNRISQLISFEDKYFQFDLGENNSSDWAIRSQMEDIYANENGYPILIALDEFQHARTINEEAEEIDKSSLRIIWQLLDNGKFQISRYSHQAADIYDLILMLRDMLAKGVKVSKGKVIANLEYFSKKMDEENSLLEQCKKGKLTTNKKSNTALFVSESNYDIIFDLAKEKFNSPFDVEVELMKLNGSKTLDFLDSILSYAKSPKTVDCSKSLIFVLGNLDEAYTMSRDFNPDMDADEFHKESLKINIPIIKKALKKRFRNEQIARLGNTHIIYPAFSKKSFKAIIALELEKITKKVEDHQNTKLQFDDTIHDLIFAEGVYPTQGTRPLFTTIHQVINTKLGKVITEMILKKLDISSIVFSAKSESIIIEYMKEDILIYELDIPQIRNLEKLRQAKQNDVQAITAIHEAGHAICSVFLMNTLPNVIFSSTADADSCGFVYSDFKWEYTSKREILNILAYTLGGHCAEKLIFGEEYVTAGSDSDIESATHLIANLLKSSGMGKTLASYQTESPKTNLYLFDTENRINKEIELWLIKATNLAEKILKEQETLLLQMADYLSDNRMMDKKQIKHYCVKYGINFSPDYIIENGDHLFYRNHLKQKVKGVSFTQNRRPPASFPISLNKQIDANK